MFIGRGKELFLESGVNGVVHLVGALGVVVLAAEFMDDGCSGAGRENGCRA